MGRRLMQSTPCFFRVPASSIKSRKRNSAPAQHRVVPRASRFHPHYHGGFSLDFADAAEFYAVREPGHQRWLEAGAREVAGAEPREKEEEDGAEKDRAGRDAYGREGHGTVELLLAERPRVNGRKDRSARTAAHFQA